jgi:hypothetical protein
MIEERLIHNARASSLVVIKLFSLGPIFAVVTSWPSESSWKFFGGFEWDEALAFYKKEVHNETEASLQFEKEREEWIREYDKGPKQISFIAE